MSMNANNAAAAAERIGRRFAENERQRAVFGLPPVSSRMAVESGPRLEIVQRDRSEVPMSSDVTARRAFAPARTISWSPVQASTHGVAVEQYRRLAAALIQAQAEHGIKVVMMTSAVSGEGKSLTLSNLAVTLARSYHRETLVIDADQRDPSQHRIFNVDGARGMTEHLRGLDDSPATTIELFPGLTLLPAGRPTSDPMADLTSKKMRQLLADAAESFDFVLVDTPPVTLIPDAGLLSPLVDAVVLVIGAGTTQYDAVARAVAMLGRDRILGTVLNRADAESFGHYGYGYGPRNG
jgi:capsular exopolysaccharide synthesis family protein